MRRSKVLAKLRSGQAARVCSMGHYLPFYIHHAANNGFDGIWLDLEHRTIDDREVQAMLAACYYQDIDCMVRPQTMGRTHLYHYLEDGATGFMVPFVSTEQIVRDVVQAIKYPPLGNRGLDGAGLDASFARDLWKPNSTYLEDANRETFIVAQIETEEALANIDAIAAVPGVDLVFVGPGDLGMRLRASGSTTTIAQAAEAAATAARKHSKAWGITAGSVEELAHWHKLGAQIVPWGSDFALARMLQRCSEELDHVLGTGPIPAQQ